MPVTARWPSDVQKIALDQMIGGGTGGVSASEARLTGATFEATVGAQKAGIGGYTAIAVR